SDSSSIEILSDSHSLVTTSHNNLTLIGLNIKSPPHYSGTDDMEESQSFVISPSPVVSGVLHCQAGNTDIEIGSTSRVLPAAHVPGKHQRSISDDLAAPVASMSSKRRTLNDAYERQSGPTGISRSAKADRAANEAYCNGTLVVLPHK
ncbi:hypothetical protein FRC06_002839, partial [Ceratobasidium sp. 370]